MIRVQRYIKKMTYAREGAKNTLDPFLSNRYLLCYLQKIIIRPDV